MPFLISTCTLNYVGPGGFISSINSLLIANLVIPHLIDLFGDVGIYVRLFNMWQLGKFMKTNQGTVFNQKEANETYKRIDMEMFTPYSYMLSTIAACIFFLPMYPFGMVICVISLIVLYWVWKVTNQLF